MSSNDSEGFFDNETSVFDRIMAARPSIQVPDLVAMMPDLVTKRPDLVAMIPNPLWVSPFSGPLDTEDFAVDPEDFVEIEDPDNISAMEIPDDPRDDGFVQENQTSWMGGLAAMREVVWNRATCFGEDCRIALYDGATMVRGSASTGALAAWNAAMRSEGWIVYNLFRRQLAIFFPSFQRAAQIQADLFFERSFWLRNLTACPAAFSLLLPILPAGLNFTRCYISDVRVSWGADPSALGKVPIAVDVESVRAAAAEVRAGSDEEVEDVITNWLDIAGGVDDQGEALPFEFQDKYPLLDGATFRCRKLELDISSPLRYGNITVSIQDLEVRAVDSSGQVQDLEQLCEDGRGELTQSFFRLYVCSEASVRYRRPGAKEGKGTWEPTEDTGNSEPTEDGGAFRTSAGDSAPEYMLYPTPLAALHSQVKNPEDLNLVLKERWQLSFPGPLSILTLPPFLADAPPPPPRDRRLSRYEGPPAEWCVQVSKAAPLWGVQRSTPLRQRKRLLLLPPLAVLAALLVGRALRRLIWPA